MMSPRFGHHYDLRTLRLVPLIGAASLLVPVFALSVGGCASNNLSGGDSRAGLVCVDDSKTCIDRRAQALQELTSSSDRSWVKDRATPRTYAAGVRMFALKSKKSVLTCEELKHGHREASRAPTVLKSGTSSGLTPAQISRGKMLASEISRDLSREIKRRCR